jgi:signal transduction histidine kinase
MRINTISYKFFWVIGFIVILASSVKAQVNYDGKRGIISIGNAIEYYVDSSSTKTIQHIQQLKRFVKYKENVPDLGLFKFPVWLKIAVYNQSRNNNLMLKFDQSLLQSIAFYYPENGKYMVNKSGELYPFNARLVNYHKLIYNLNIAHGTTGVYYARIQSSHQMQMAVFLGMKADVEDSSLKKNMWFGIFFGIILVMFFYNLFVYFSIKDPIYLYYVVYILVVGLVQSTIEGYSFQFLWPNNSFLATRSFFLLTALVNITGLEFTRKFLNTKSFLPRLDKFSYFLYSAYAVAITFTLSGLLHLSYQILQGFAGLVSLYILTICILIAKRGYRPAKFFLIAWAPLIAGIIIWILKDFDVFSYNMFTNYSIAYGSALEVILLSFALADKINIFKADKERSQEETLKALKENERIIREQNLELELKVNKRTLELSKSNTELNTTLEDLKQAQSQLVDAEKMASLGQLTAGIAHEINNPINFVTSNINPLKRDIDMVLGALKMVEEVNALDLPLADKLKKIQDYKEELDFDYLLIEINHLLKGITEGANRTAEIVKGLRIFSRLDENDLKKADLNEGLDSTLIIANNLLNKIKVVKEYSSLPYVECYAGKLNQVFLNIISNAAYAVHKKFGDNTGGEIIITTTYDNENVSLSIKDNGTGMDDQIRKKIFEPFFTTKDVGEGTGLGLSIAYNTIKNHNGRISINSAIGEGTEFVLHIPIVFNVK